MKVVFFCHSLVSDWNHGNAHFLRGVVWELLRRGHRVEVFEPRDGWSRRHLRAEWRHRPLAGFRRAYPGLASSFYLPGSLDPARVLAGADLVLVHEWNDPDLVARLGRHRRLHGGCRLLFHDTHHRCVSAPQELARCDLSGYDGVLAFGASVRDIYLARGWTGRAWVWHEGADTRLFHPLPGVRPRGDLVWVGNWGDEERTGRITELLIEPVRRLGLKARIHGVRYPRSARLALRRAGIRYAGWLPNFRVPEAFAAHRLTVHIPRGPYVRDLPGIPTIRVFEALACGIPLVSGTWEDSERLFTPGEDFLVARTGREMEGHLRFLLAHPQEARRMAERGRRTVLGAHTCAHRVDELLAIGRSLGIPEERPGAGRPAEASPAGGRPGGARSGGAGA